MILLKISRRSLGGDDLRSPLSPPLARSLGASRSFLCNFPGRLGRRLGTGWDLLPICFKVRPIHHRLEGRVRAHVFLCMLAYYVEWHMRKALAPMLFVDDAPREPREDVVSPKKPSPSAARKARTKKTLEGAPVHSFQTLLADLSTIIRNSITPNLEGAPAWQQETEPSALQQRAFDLLKKIPAP